MCGTRLAVFTIVAPGSVKLHVLLVHTGATICALRYAVDFPALFTPVAVASGTNALDPVFVHPDLSLVSYTCFAILALYLALLRRLPQSQQMQWQDDGSHSRIAAAY